MTPEQKARLIVLENEFNSTRETAIAEAIRTARLEALEEAAKIIEDAEYEPQSVYSAIRQAAAAIRERAKECQP